MYDYGSRAAIEHTLAQIKAHAPKHPVVVVARGRLTRDLIERENPWLSQVHPPQHLGNYTIFQGG
jgi:hypothetical protein